MMQSGLFHESILDAARECVQALGGTKAVGARMRPDIPPDQAGRWLSDCLNDARREHLSPDQVAWLAREGRAVNCHAILLFMCAQAGYAPPVPVEPDDERDALMREYVASAKMLRGISERIERLNLQVVA